MRHPAHPSIQRETFSHPVDSGDREETSLTHHPGLIWEKLELRRRKGLGKPFASPSAPSSRRGPLGGPIMAEVGRGRADRPGELAGGLASWPSAEGT